MYSSAMKRRAAAVTVCEERRLVCIPIRLKHARLSLHPDPNSLRLLRRLLVWVHLEPRFPYRYGPSYRLPVAPATMQSWIPSP
jgi:hypothetical protein